MGSHQEVELSRDCDAIAIPDGTPTMINKGTSLTITQALGSFTVMNKYGQMFRIEFEDSGALGIDSPSDDYDKLINDDSIPLSERVWNHLRTCYDPEIPVNIVDLGLIYRCDVYERNEKDFYVEVDMTLTTPGCGMGDVLQKDIERKLQNLPGITEVKIQLVFDPPWSPERMSEEAQLDLGML
jgi:probable FeS assembly SUF system protein SufT